MLKQSEIFNLFYSMTDRKPFAASGFCGVKILLVIGYNTIDIPDIFYVFLLL